MLSYGGHIAFISCTINPVLSYPHIYPHFFCLYIYLGSFLVTVQKFCTTHCEEIDPAFPVAAKGRISLFLYLYMQWFGFCFLRDMKQICKMNSNRPFAYIWSCIILYTILLSADTVIYIYSLLLYVFVSGTKWISFSLLQNAMGPFKKEFGESDDEMDVPEHSTKPADFDLLFSGDIDDHFLFGIKLTK